MPTNRKVTKKTVLPSSKYPDIKIQSQHGPSDEMSKVLENTISRLLLGPTLTLE